MLGVVEVVPQHAAHHEAAAQLGRERGVGQLAAHDLVDILLDAHFGAVVVVARQLPARDHAAQPEPADQVFARIVEQLRDLAPAIVGVHAHIGAVEPLAGWIVGASYVGTNAQGSCNTGEFYCFYTSLSSNGSHSDKTKDAGRDTVVLSVSKTF